MPGDSLIRWTIRLSLLLYAAVMALRLRGGKLPGVARWVWGAGALLLLIHTLVAFHFAHNWDHAHAVAATTKGTYDVIGVAWEGGLYVNYAFTLCWIADALWWIAAPASHERRAGWLNWLLHVFLAFIIINATIVFHSGFIRWSGMAACVLLAVIAFRASAAAPTPSADGR